MSDDNIIPFIQPKVPPPRPRPTVAQVIEDLRSSRDPAKQAIYRELNKLVRKARSADLTHKKRGSEEWIAEFVRVLEGGRPNLAPPKKLGHTMVANRLKDATPEQIERLSDQIALRATLLADQLRRKMGPFGTERTGEPDGS